MSRVTTWLTVATVGGGCIAHTKETLGTGSGALARVDRDTRGELRITAPDGRRTDWLPLAKARVVGDALCFTQRDRVWADVDAVLVSDLTDATIGHVLAGLPESIDVVHLMGGEIELRTRGQDLTPWLRARTDDPAGADVRRYRVRAWHHLSPAMTWAELAHAGFPMLGYDARDAVIEIRRVSIGKTIVGSIATVLGAMAVESIGLLQHAHVPESGPQQDRDRPPRLRGDMVFADAREPDRPGTWESAPCESVAGDAK